MYEVNLTVEDDVSLLEDDVLADMLLLGDMNDFLEKMITHVGGVKQR